jgi:hypothetical protein
VVALGRAGAGTLAPKLRRLAYKEGGIRLLADLSALTPPFLVAAAFLIAVGAFIRHEMRGAKNQPADQRDDVEEPSNIDQIGDRSSGSTPDVR